MNIIKTIFLDEDYEKEAAKLEGECPDTSHVRKYIVKTRRIVTPHGETTAALLRGVIPSELHELGFKSCWDYVHGLPSRRANAVGSPSMPRVKKDRTLSTMHGVSKSVLSVVKKRGTRTDVLGFVGGPRDMSRFTRHHPKILYRNRALFELVDKLYREYLPDFYARQQMTIEQFPNRRLWDTAFSSCYLAKKFPTNYHRDGNLKGAMTALMATGHFTGGELVIPRWGIAIVLRPGDLLFFDAEELHGNLEIKGDRLSFAFHCTAMRRLIGVGADQH